MKYPAVASILTLLLTTNAFAGASPIEFTVEELAASHQNAKLISETAAACLQKTWETHNKFYQQRQYSKYYGNRKPEHKTAQGRKEVLLRLLPELNARVARGDRNALAELTKREQELEATSCIGLTLKCLGDGFKTAGMDDTWQKIWDWLARKGDDGAPLFYGTDLQKALVDLGWKSMYWNPDLSMNEEWDRLEAEMNPVKEGKKWNPIWGGHAYRWSLVKRKQDYYGIPVQDIQTLVNFGGKTPEEFKKVPFFVGTAHAGYHVFPGYKGQVIEAHSMRELKSHHNLEVGAFNPLVQEVNGVPNGNGAPKWTRIEHYRSGMILVPPGYISDKPYVEPKAAVGTPPNRAPRPEGADFGDQPQPPLDLNPPRRDPRNDPWFDPQPRRRDRGGFPWFR